MSTKLKDEDKALNVDNDDLVAFISIYNALQSVQRPQDVAKCHYVDKL